VDINETLTKTPSIIVRDPYGEGWAVLIQPAKLESDLKNLLHTVEQLTEWALKEKSNLQKK
jgi:glycine cleavage system H lipoate-binding protein